jgi:REP element-mobilizing transposase RayT
MHFIEDDVYHVYNRGNNRNIIFYDQKCYLAFLDKINSQIKPHCDILTWALMPTHFHFMIMANSNSVKPRLSGKLEIQELSYRIGILLSSYSQTINKRNDSRGSLFQQKTKAKNLCPKSVKRNDHPIINCMHYIHQNPWKAGLVKKIEDWEYSSFRDFCGLRNGKLCNKELLIDLTGYDLQTFYQDSYDIIPDIGSLFE